MISAVGEQVEEQVFTDNGITLSAKGRPSFCTNVPGVYAAGDALRGPATVVEGIADAARFAEAVIGAPHTYDIPAEAHPTEAEVIARKGILRAPGKVCCEGRALPELRHRLPELRGRLPEPRQRRRSPAGRPHGDRARRQNVQRVRQLHGLLSVCLRAVQG